MQLATQDANQDWSVNDCPICEWTPGTANYDFVYETRFWQVVLAPNQSLVGRCIVYARRHTGSLADLTPEEILDWLTLVGTHEAALKSAFGVTLFNWSCYMNHAFRAPSPSPHVHWWAVPRYDHQVSIGGWVFEDPDFGDPYNHDRWLEVPGGLRQKLVAQIQQAIR